MRSCRACPLWETRQNAVPGEGNIRASVVLVGEAPGAREDLQGRPFVGTSGKLLTKLLRAAGLRREDVFITNVVKCRPPGNRPPKPGEVKECRHFLERQLAVLAPKMVCTLGNSSLRALADPEGNISHCHGQVIEKDGIRYLPLYHPAAILYRRRLLADMEKDIKKLKRLSGIGTTGLEAFCIPAGKGTGDEEQ